MNRFAVSRVRMRQQADAGTNQVKLWPEQDHISELLRFKPRRSAAQKRLGFGGSKRRSALPTRKEMDLMTAFDMVMES